MGVWVYCGVLGVKGRGSERVRRGELFLLVRCDDVFLRYGDGRVWGCDGGGGV